MAKRWDHRKSDEGENARVDVFLQEVIELCKKHGLSISHEDSHGGFIIESLSEHNIEHLSQAAMDVDD